jgi:DNA (cytosine-5)-methyltransferase 1
MTIKKLNVLDLFSGIGGFSLGLESTTRFQTIAFCEIDKYCQCVLSQHWPSVPIFEDITTLDLEQLNNLPKIDVICGGFPCQPVSVAGHKKGECDERWMWPEFYRIICLVKPTWVLVENVVGLLSIGQGKLFGGILSDLANAGYNAEWKVLSGNMFGLPQIRKRVFLVAYSMRERLHKNKIFERRRTKCTTWTNMPIVYLEDFRRSYPEIPEHLRVVNGISGRLDKIEIDMRIKMLGNSIIPKCSEYVGNCIINCIYDIENDY